MSSTSPPVAAAPQRRPGFAPTALSLAELARIGLVVAIAAGLGSSLAVAVQVGLSEGLLCMLGVAALMAVAVPIVLGGHGELHDPIWLVLLTVAIGLTGRAFYVLFGPPSRVEFLLLDKVPSDLVFAALISAGSLLLLSLGYLAGNVRWRAPSLARLAAGDWHPRKFAAVVGILVIFGLLSILVFAVRLNVSFEQLSDLSSKRHIRAEGEAGRGAVQGYLRWGAILVEIAFYLAFARWASLRQRLRSKAGLLVCLLIALALFFPLFVSSRRSMMFILMRTCLLWLVIRGQPRKRYVAIAVAVGLTLMGAMLAFRRNATDWESVRAHVSVANFMEMTVGGRHFLGLAKTAHVVEGVPGVVDYQYGRTMVTWLLAPIPRSVWPDKPAVGPGSFVGPALLGAPETSGVPPGVIAELYLNFGLLGVAVGMTALGLLIRSMYETFRPHLASPAVAVIFVILSSRLAFDLAGNSFAGTTMRLLMELIPLAIALRASVVSPRPAIG